MAIKEIRTILYATDLTENSQPAGDYALTLAKLSGGRVYVLHVIEHLTARQRSMIRPEDYKAFEKEVEIDAFRDMKRFCAEVFEETVEFDTEAVIGKPHEEIVRKAAELPADLIVMGTHGRSGMEHFLLGSTAERVLRSATVPILTVRAAD